MAIELRLAHKTIKLCWSFASDSIMAPRKNARSSGQMMIRFLVSLANDVDRETTYDEMNPIVV